MGTTMHAHIEVKLGNDWLHFATPSVQRDYTLFELINELHAETVDNKIIDMASEVTRKCFAQDCDSYRIHDMFVLQAEDLPVLQQRLWDAHTDKSILDLDLEGSIFHTYVNGNTLAQHQGWDDLRIIGWYDN